MSYGYAATGALVSSSRSAISSGASQFGVWPQPSSLRKRLLGRPALRPRRADQAVELAPGDRRRDVDPVEVLADVRRISALAAS